MHVSNSTGPGCNVNDCVSIWVINKCQSGIDFLLAHSIIPVLGKNYLGTVKYFIEHAIECNVSKGGKILFQVQ